MVDWLTTAMHDASTPPPHPPPAPLLRFDQLLEFRLSSAQLRAWAEAITPKTQTKKALPPTTKRTGATKGDANNASAGGDGGGGGGNSGGGGGAKVSTGEGGGGGSGRKSEPRRAKAFGKLKSAAGRGAGAVGGEGEVERGEGDAEGEGGGEDEREAGAEGADEGKEPKMKEGMGKLDDDGIALGLGGVGGPPEVGLTSKTKGRFASQVRGLRLMMMMVMMRLVRRCV